MKKTLLFLALIFLQITYSQTVTIPDANFKAALIEDGVDTNNDGEIQVSEAEAVTEIDVSNENINSLEGIQYFINLTYLDCSYNDITALDLSSTTKLTNLICNNNHIDSLDVTMLSDLINLECNNMRLNNSLQVSGLSNLENLVASSNSLSNIDLTGLTSLKELYMAFNEFTSTSDIIGLENLINLEVLNMPFNSLTTLDVSTLINLKVLLVLDNQISSMNLSGNINLETVRVEDNQLTSLDLSNLSKLHTIYTHNNLMETLFLKNGSSEADITLGLFLEYICVDQGDEERLRNIAPNNCVVNSFCTFEPGGEVYYIQGNVKVDVNQDGCDSDDIGFPFMQFVVTDTNGNYGTFSSELDGSYNIPLPEGDYTINYQSPYMSYFNISPASFSVDFSTNTSPFVQDICLTPNATYNDLQVVIIPLEEARPGFDARYKIIYANVGTTPLSGNVQFTFQENVLDYVSSSVSPDTQNTGELNWSFSNLAPLEFKFIEVTMNLNAPTETPPLNGGEILCYEALITPVTNDQRVNDNTFTLKQTVVNSYDPNDKTCLEGNTVTPDLIGEYVHYLIRFENTGTASAINVVVKDVIDMAKFDISSLVIYDSSHDMVTRIQNTNEVEFIFEGINLPFDDANNDGYIAFKIKTLPSLVVGDTFENTAEIYFDFNFPIITNTEQTTIDNTASVDDVFATANMRVFPNPVNALFTIESSVSFDSLAIYDLKGRQLQLISSTTPQLTKQIDLSNFANGIYYVSVQSGTAKKLLKVIRE